jgi:hypothetical protein
MQILSFPLLTWKAAQSDFSQAFTKVEKSDDSAKGFIWVLEPSAIREGVKSTTRYRKVTSKKTGKSETSMPQRRASSGRRAGKSTKKTWKPNRVRKSERAATATSSSSSSSPPADLQRGARLQQTIIGDCSPVPSADRGDPPPPTWPYHDGVPAAAAHDAAAPRRQHHPQPPRIKREHPPPTPFLFQDIVGVSVLPYGGEEPFFCEPSSSSAASGYPSNRNDGDDPLANPFFGSQEMM